MMIANPAAHRNRRIIPATGKAKTQLANKNQITVCSSFILNNSDAPSKPTLPDLHHRDSLRSAKGCPSRSPNARVKPLLHGSGQARPRYSETDPAESRAIAELLKAQGYATGQFGKNHLGDRNEYLPTVHGFDEFYGNLYHLNAEEEPELPDYPKDPAFRAKFGPRGVMDSKRRIPTIRQ